MGVAGSLFTQTPTQSRSCLHCQWPGCLGESSHLVMSQQLASSKTRQVVILSNKTSSQSPCPTRQVVILSNKTSSQSPCPTRQVVILSSLSCWHRLKQDKLSSCPTRQVVILSKKTSSHPVQQDKQSSCPVSAAGIV